MAAEPAAMPTEAVPAAETAANVTTASTAEGTCTSDTANYYRKPGNRREGGFLEF